jgi:hypothetical protein
LIIVQYTGGTSYNLLLELTEPINRAYAQVWRYDFLRVDGFLIQDALPDQNKRANHSESRATYNKVMILERLLHNNTYDLALILDSDAMIFDFGKDLANWLNFSAMLTAHKVNPKDSDSTTNINIGVGFWNLRHPVLPIFVQRWKQACMDRILKTPDVRDSDQNPLQMLLHRIPTANLSSIISAVPDNQLGYSRGSVIKHFIRSQPRKWTNQENLEARAFRIRIAILDLCGKFLRDIVNHSNICHE